MKELGFGKLEKKNWGFRVSKRERERERERDKENEEIFFLCD